MEKKGKKLKISCGTVDCENGLHCYRRTKREALRAINHGGAGSAAEITAGPIRFCKACGKRLVDWNRVHQRDVHDLDHTFRAMQTEWIRHHFWHRKIDEKALAYAFKKGRTGLRERLASQIAHSIGKPASQLFRDGAQTPLGLRPKSENILYFAQHATASCCRKCVEEWHNIPREQALSDRDIEYLTDLAMRFIVDRLPSLPESPGTAPPPGIEVGTVDVADFEHPRPRPAGAILWTFDKTNAGRNGVHRGADSP